MQGVAPTVFVSSRFDEFKDLRRLLRERLGQNRLIRCEVVDHSENYPDTRPPLARSLEAARSSDVFVLLVGETYGTVPPGHDRSYTELEYEAAIARSGNARVLAYFFDGPDNGPRDPRVAAFRKRIRENQTHAQYGLAEEGRDVAMDITLGVLGLLLPFAPAGASDDDTLPWLDGEDGDDGAVSAALAAARDRRIEDHPALQLADHGMDALKHTTLLAHPGLTAAMEQRNEAVRAIRIGERRWAIWHLHQALRHRPLDLPALYWCAHLRLASLRREDASRALPLALRAARIAEKSLAAPENGIPVAACYMLAARAAGDREEKAGDAVEFATRAQEAAGYYWRTHVEAARQHALAGDAIEAMKQLGRAFYLRPGVLEAFRGDPAFRRCPKEYAALRRRLLEVTRGEVDAILAVEERLWDGLRGLAALVPEELSGFDAGWLGEGQANAARERGGVSLFGIFPVLKSASASFDRQHAALRALGRQALTLADSEPLLAERLTQAAREFEETRAHVDREMRRIRGEVTDTLLDPGTTVGSPGGVAAAALALAALALLVAGTVVAGVMVLFLSAIVFVASGVMLENRRHEESRRQRLDEQDMQLSRAEDRKRLAEAGVEQTRADIDHALRTGLALFVTLSRNFENRALKRGFYSRARSPENAAVGALARLSPVNDAATFALDERLVPEALDPWMPPQALPTLEHQLYRVMPGSPLRVASRQAVYFGA